jgi:ABC-type sugar transport system ATPase subunit
MNAEPATVQPDGAPDDVLRVSHVAKSFGPVTALRDVSMHLRKGEVLGLIGDNGAGKSTLVKILSGFHQPDKGDISIFGQPVSLKSVIHARSLGIDTVYQDLALVPTLSVAHNMFLNREVTKGMGPFRMLSNGEMRRRARKYLDDIGIRTLRSVQAEVAMLSGGQRQAIAIARSVHSGARILLLDEPLAAMGAKEGEMILDLIRDLKQSGHSMIVVAHNYVHVLEVCDRVVLLQHGEVTLDKLTSETSVQELTALVVAEYRALKQEREG